MMPIDAFRFDGMRVLVVGGATGMGRAGAELTLALGADVVVMDRAAVPLRNVEVIDLDLSRKASIEAAVGQIRGAVDVVFACAGVAEGTRSIETINFVGHRYLLDRLVATGKLGRGGRICFISSSAGLGWEAEFSKLAELLDISDFDEAAEWLRANGKASYLGTKQAVCAYVAREALSYLKRGIRINALCPGPTDTPLAQANDWLGGGADYREQAGIKPSDPLEQALPLAFLCSDAASAITGVTLVADLGWFNAGLVHSFPPASPMAEHIIGRRIVAS